MGLISGVSFDREGRIHLLVLRIWGMLFGVALMDSHGSSTGVSLCTEAIQCGM
jgi:hypothetical protein